MKLFILFALVFIIFAQDSYTTDYMGQSFGSMNPMGSCQTCLIRKKAPSFMAKGLIYIFF
jgi:hypothetical protein